MDWHGYSSEQIALKNCLEHHGVKGQRWGVRRYQNADGSLTDAGRKRYSQEISLDKAYSKTKKDILYIKGKKAVGQTVSSASGLAGGALAYAATGNPLPLYGGLLAASTANTAITNKADKQLSEYRIKHNQLSKQKFVIQEGAKLNRVEIGDLDTNTVSRIYALYNKDKYGASYYDQEWPKRLKQFANDPNTKVNKNTYEVKTKIVAPDIDTRMKIADEMFKEKKLLYKDMIKSESERVLRVMSGDYTAKNLKELSKKYPDMKNKVDQWAKSISEKENKSMTDASNFKIFMSAFPKNEKLSTEYIKRLSAKGYGAMFDNNSSQVADAPLIIFDKNMLKKIDSKNIA